MRKVPWLQDGVMTVWMFVALRLLLPPPGVEKVQVHTSILLCAVTSHFSVRVAIGTVLAYV